MTDVVIPADTAEKWAAFIRNNCGDGRLAGLDDLADLLDPVRDESNGDPLVADLMEVMSDNEWTCGGPETTDQLYV